MSSVAEEYTALKIWVDPETMSYFISKLKQSKKYIAKRCLSHITDIDDWCTEKSLIEQWKLESLASISKYNWAFFLLKSDNLPNTNPKLMEEQL